MLPQREVQCPFCGEFIEVILDPSAGDQDYVEDCGVCCQPIHFLMRVGDDGEIVALEARRDDD